MDIGSRATNMIASPRREWEVVAAESIDTQELYLGYVLPLAAIPPVCQYIGNSLLFGPTGYGVGILGAIVTYILSLICVYILGWVAAKLAPMFGGRDDFAQGLKLIAFGWTATWLGGVFELYPGIGLLGLVAAIYSLYLIFIGIAPVLGTPAERVPGHFLALFVASIVVYVIVGVVVNDVVGAGLLLGGVI